MQAILTALSDEFSKIAFVAKTPRMKVELHHGTSKKDWKKFESNLNSPLFRKEVLKHPGSDSKLKRYTKNYGGYLESTDIVGKAPSRSGGMEHEVRKLPNGRLGCDCKDWQYVHSVRNTDCDHIQAVKSSSKKRILVKKAASILSDLSPLYSGLAISGEYHRAHKKLRKGKEMERRVDTWRKEIVP